MGIRGVLRRNWRLILNIATIVALVTFAFAIRKQFIFAFHNLFRVNLWWLLLLVPIEALNYHSQAMVYQRLFAIFGKVIDYVSLLRIAFELNFVNHVFPSGGVTGISYFGYRLRRHDVSAGRATLVQSMKLILLFVSFELLLFIGLVILSLGGHIGNQIVLISTILTMMVLFGTAIFVYVIGSLGRVHGFLNGLEHMLTVLRRLLLPDAEPVNLHKAHKLFEEYHQDFVELRSQYTQLEPPFWWSLISNATEVLAVYVVYLAFGAHINIGAIIIAYAVANFAGLISVLPGGAGIYEALMTITLVAAGVPVSLSLPVTIMYRVVNNVIQLTPGFILYQRTLHGSRPAEVAKS